MGSGMGIAFDKPEIDGSSFWEFTDGSGLLTAWESLDKLCKKHKLRKFSSYMFDVYDELLREFKKQCGKGGPTDEQMEEFHDGIEDKMADANVEPRYFECEEILQSMPIVLNALQTESRWKKEEEIGKELLPEVIDCLKEIERLIITANKAGAKFHFYMCQ